MKNGTATAPETLSFERGPRLPGLGENFKNFDTSYLRGGTEGLQMDGDADCKEGRPAWGGKGGGLKTWGGGGGEKGGLRNEKLMRN